AGDFTLVMVAVSAVGAVVSMDAPQGTFAAGMIVVDPFAAFFKFVISMAALVVAWLSTRTRENEEVPTAGPVSWALFGLSLLGMDLMVSAIHVLTAWAGFQLATMTSALWIATRRDAAFATQAGLTTLLEAAAASALMTLDYATLGGKLAPALAAPGGKAVMFAALALVIVGLGQKLAIVPWQQSRVDLAESSALPVSAWLQVGSTIAGLAMLARLLRTALSGASGGDGWATLPGVEWPALLSVIAMVTMTVGNAAALRETNLKRLLAWLSVAQTGYLLAGLAALSDEGLGAVLFHSVAYALMTFGAMAAIAPVMEAAGSDDIEVLRGLARRRGGARVAAVAIALFFLALSAVPPLAGYTGRVLILAAVIKAGGYALALVAALSSGIGLLCCTRVVVTLLDRPVDADETVPLDFEVVVLAGLLMAGTIGVGLWPGPLTSFVERSVVFFGG
ncbi:MAG: NADH-quinone oxidoreductase subunit N, partial [Candidatus Binatia bacterium]